MKTVLSLCCFSDVFMSKDKINAFSMSKHKGGNVFCLCIRVTRVFFGIQFRLEVCIFTELFGKGSVTRRNCWNFEKISKRLPKDEFWNGFEITQEEKMFLSLFLSVKLKCIFLMKVKFCMLFWWLWKA
jgi:hypothetical protein